MMGWVRFAATVLLLWMGGLGYGAAAEVIHSFDSTVVLAKDGELIVTERIRVDAQGVDIRRGIFRDFPLISTDAQGRRREVPFELLGVTRDGKPEPYFTERNDGGFIRIYAGDKKKLLPFGDHTYVIRYRTARQVRWFDGKPEFNWNVTGNFWAFPITSASYRLELADKMEPARWTAFTGRVGDKGSDWRGAVGSDGVLTVSTTRPLRSGEGLTVVAALPDGAVAPPTLAQEWWDAFLEHRIPVLGVLGFMLVLGYYLVVWYRVGRDPKPGTILPVFHPPKGISPALANYIHHLGLDHQIGGWNWRAFTASVFSLAVKGFLRFDNNGGTLTLKATGKKPTRNATALAMEERIIHTALDRKGGTLAITSSSGKIIASLEEEFSGAIKSKNEGRFFSLNLRYATIGAGLAIFYAFVLAFFLSSAGLFLLAVGLIVLAGLFFYLLPAPTPLGRSIMDQLDGLKLYLQTAESDRLNLRAPEMTANRFEALLPYAVALDVEEPWSSAFAAALNRAYPGETDPMDPYQSEWIDESWSDSDSGKVIVWMIEKTFNALSNATASVSSSDSSSSYSSLDSSGYSGFSSGGGGSGGGGSGGGGGGGGGGGW